MHNQSKAPPEPQQPRLPRMTAVALITVVLLALLAYLAPQQLPVVLYKCALVTMGAVLGYWIDRMLFPYARPHQYHQFGDRWFLSLAALRRAVIVLACVLGLTLGL